VVALGDVRSPTGGIRVRRAGGRQIAVELVQMAAHRMPPVAVAEHPEVNREHAPALQFGGDRRGEHLIQQQGVGLISG
jgi:hypothetical protein